MARTTRGGTPDTTSGGLHRCVKPFTVWDARGIPSTFAAGREVLDDDPILKTHAAHFEPATRRVLADRARVESATAAPGEQRSVTPQPDPDSSPTEDDQDEPDSSPSGKGDG